MTFFYTSMVFIFGIIFFYVNELAPPPVELGCDVTHHMEPRKRSKVSRRLAQCVYAGMILVALGGGFMTGE